EPAAPSRRTQPAPAHAPRRDLVTDGPGARVRVTSARTSAARSRRRRSNAAEIDALTRLGEVYVQSLIRAQLRLAGYVVLALAASVGLLPLLFRVLPVGHVHVLGIPLPWV